MAVRRVFPMANNYFQGNAAGICTVASLQWAKRCLQLNRGLGNFDELSLTPHQMGALMAVWRQHDADPDGQTTGMGLARVGADLAVTQIIDVQRYVNITPPHICIFWNSTHTMGYRLSTRYGREVEFFDIENGLWVCNNDADMRAKILATFAGVYTAIEGMRVVKLP